MSILSIILGTLFPIAVYISPGAERLGWENLNPTNLDDITPGDQVKIVGIIVANQTVALNGTEYYSYVGSEGYRWRFENHNLTLRNYNNSTHVVLTLRDAIIRKGPHRVEGHFNTEATCYWNNDTVYAVGNVEKQTDGQIILVAEVIAPVNDFGSAKYFHDGFFVMSFFVIPPPFVWLFLRYLNWKNEQLIEKGSPMDIRNVLGRYSYGKINKDYPNAEHHRTLRYAKSSLFAIPFAVTIGPALILITSTEHFDIEMFLVGVLISVSLMMVPVAVGANHNGTPVRIRIKDSGFQVKYPSKTREYYWEDIKSLEFKDCKREKDRTAQIMIIMKMSRFPFYLYPLSWDLADSLLLESKTNLAKSVNV